jgi:hypothetical protein
MAKRYLTQARHHAERIRYYFDHAGPNGHSQALYHYNELGECYSKSARALSGEATALHQLYLDAGKLMDDMKRREGVEAEAPPTDP